LLHAHVYSGFKYQLIDLRRIPAHAVTKICFCGDHDDLCRLRIQLNEALGDRAHLTFSAVDCLEVLPVGCNKGAALAVLSQHLGLTMQDCMAFGDAMNDREMLGSVGRGLIMGNAMPQLKAELPHLPVIGHCRNEAVSHFLTHWLDNNLLIPPNSETLPASQTSVWLFYFTSCAICACQGRYRRYWPAPTLRCSRFPDNARRCRTAA
jgi:HMP-PP phosphatase